MATPSSVSSCSRHGPIIDHCCSRWCCNTIFCSVDIWCRLLGCCGSPSAWIHWRRTSESRPFLQNTKTPTVSRHTKEKPVLFRRYISLHTLAAIAAFALGAAWIIISAARHNTAKSDCLSDFFNTEDSTLQSEGDTLCEIFPWVDVGIMGAIWILLAIVHVSV